MKVFRVVFISLCLIIGMGLYASAQPELSVGSVVARPGETAQLELYFSGDPGPYAGVNAALSLPTGVTLNSTAEGTLLSGGNYTTDYSSDHGSVIVYSAEDTFSSSQSESLLTLTLQVAIDAPSGSFPITITTSGLSNDTGSESVAHTQVVGNITINGVVLTPGLYQEDEPGISYSGNWTSAPGSGANGGAFTYTNDPSATAAFSFEGTGMTIYRTRHSSRGDMEVCVDGTCYTVPNYSATLMWAQPYVWPDTLAEGTHTVTISNTSTDYIDLDAVEVDPSGTCLAAGLHQEDDSAISYSGTWASASASGASGGALMYTNDPAATVEFCFEGTALTIYRTLHLSRGDMEVCVDGTCYTEPNYSATLMWAQAYNWPDTLAEGTHTVTISNTSTDYIDLDAVEVDGTCVLTAGLVQETHGCLSYSGAWSPASAGGASGGAITYTNDPAATVEFSFTGTDVTIYRTLYSNRGDMEVCVDSACHTVSNYSASLVWAEPYDWPDTLSAGEHTVTISNSSTAYIDLDAVEVPGGAPAQAPALAPVTILKTGTGNGTIIAGDQECGPGCAELVIPYVTDGSMTVTVEPAAGSFFAGWETVGGDPIGQTFYANPGETVVAVFELQ